MDTSATQHTWLMPTREAGKEFLMRNIQGSVVMLNLLRFREYADYSADPHLAPEFQITGEMAYQLYINHTLPYLEKSGGEILFWGRGGNFLIGPADERWDAVMLVRQQSVSSFISFESNEAYMAGIGHRTAALENTRLLPLTENNNIKNNNFDQ